MSNFIAIEEVYMKAQINLDFIWTDISLSFPTQNSQ